MRVLLISNLRLSYLEKTQPPTASPGTDFIILNGDTCSVTKRTLMYIEDAAIANPNVPCLFNIGLLDFTYAPYKNLYDVTNFRYNVVKSGRQMSTLRIPQK